MIKLFIYLYYRFIFFKWSWIASSIVFIFKRLFNKDYSFNRLSMLAAIWEEDPIKKDMWLTGRFKYKPETIDFAGMFVGYHAASNFSNDCEDFAMMARLVYPTDKYKGKIVFIIHKQWNLRKFNHAVFVRPGSIYTSGVITHVSLNDYLRHNLLRIVIGYLKVKKAN